MNSYYWQSPISYPASGQLPVFIPPPQLGLPNINPMDWSLVDAIDIETLSSYKDRKTMNKFTSAFLDATTFIEDKPGLIEKMIQILQVCVGDLQVQNIKYKTINTQLAEENSGLRKQIQILKKDSTQICPICNKFTANMSSLDSHIFKRHQNLAPIWKIIRTPFESKPEQFNALASTLKIYQSPKSKHEEVLKKHVRELSQQMATMRGEFEGLKATIGSQLIPPRRHKSQKKRRHSHKEVFSFSLPPNEEFRQSKSNLEKIPPKAQTPPSQNKSMIEKRVKIRHSPPDKENEKLVKNKDSISENSEYDKIIEISDIPKPLINQKNNVSNQNVSSVSKKNVSSENFPKFITKQQKEIFRDDVSDNSTQYINKSKYNEQNPSSKQLQNSYSKSNIDDDISLEFSSEEPKQDITSSESSKQEIEDPKPKRHTMWSASSSIASTDPEQASIKTDQKARKAELLRNSIDDLLKERQLARQKSLGIAEVIRKKPSNEAFDLTEPEIEEPINYGYGNAYEDLDFEEFHNTPRHILRHTDSLENGDFFAGDPGPICEEDFEEDYEYNEQGDLIPIQDYGEDDIHNKDDQIDDYVYKNRPSPKPTYGHNEFIDNGPSSSQSPPRIISRRNITHGNRLITTRMESPPIEEISDVEEDNDYVSDYVDDGSQPSDRVIVHPNGTLSTVSGSSSTRSENAPTNVSVAQMGVDWGVAYGGPDGRAVVKMSSSESSPSHPIQDNWRATRRSTDNFDY